MTKAFPSYLLAAAFALIARPDNALSREADRPQRFGLPASPIEAPPPRGLVAVISNDPSTQLDLSAFDNPSIGGVAIQIHWADIQGAQGSPDWSRLDALFDRADTTHKWVQLLIYPGFFSPSWALTGAASEPFAVQYGPGKGTTLALPMPWDTAYLDNWFGFARQVASRYGNRVSFRVMAAAGPTSVSVEATLPNTPADISTWKTLGYTSEKYVAAWASVFREFAADFRGQYVSLSLGGGVNIEGTGLRPTTKDLIAAGRGILGGRFVIQNSNIGPSPGSESRSLLAVNIGRMITGYQMQTSATRTAANEGGDAATLLRQTIDNAMAPGPTGGQINYLEIYNADVSAPALQSTLQYGASFFSGPEPPPVRHVPRVSGRRPQ